jgi:hypothetical protein
MDFILYIMYLYIVNYLLFKIIYSYWYVCSVLCSLSDCVVLCTVCV